jgi:hypothetical protein
VKAFTCFCRPFPLHGSLFCQENAVRGKTARLFRPESIQSFLLSERLNLAASEIFAAQYTGISSPLNTRHHGENDIQVRNGFQLFKVCLLVLTCTMLLITLKVTTIAFDLMKGVSFARPRLSETKYQPTFPIHAESPTIMAVARGCSC